MYSSVVRVEKVEFERGGEGVLTVNLHGGFFMNAYVQRLAVAEDEYEFRVGWGFEDWDDVDDVREVGFEKWVEGNSFDKADYVRAGLVDWVCD